MMLEPVTQLPGAPLGRRHAPTGKYEDFRPCLRWDFGFTCAFCLLHEADFFELGTEGTGLMWAEHVVPQSKDAGQAHLYENCIWSCRFCNNPRSNRPNEDTKNRARLLSPVLVAWADHFAYDNFAITVKRTDDLDGKYTLLLYKLADKRKTELRRLRYLRLTHFLATSERLSGTSLQLAARARSEKDSAKKAELMEAIEQMTNAAELLLGSVRRYHAHPADAPKSCACTVERLELPSWLVSSI